MRNKSQKLKIISVFLGFLIVGCEESYQEPFILLNPITRITDDKAIDNFCTISPNGQYIAFSSNSQGNFDIYIKPINEKALIQKTQGKEDDLFPQFSPDGKRIAFSSNRFGSFDIFLMDAEKGGPIQQITFDQEREECAANFSPDGGKILFTSFSKKGKAPLLMIVDLQKGLLTELTNGYFGRFSPDGERIVFGRNGDIWMIGIDGKNESLIFHSDNFDCMFPNFSPEGERIVYTSYPKDWEKKGILRFDTKIEGIKDTKMVHIRVVNIEGRADTQLTGEEGCDGFPVWSNDGFIYFSSLRDGNVDIFRVSAPKKDVIKEEKKAISPPPVAPMAKKKFPQPKEVAKTGVVTTRDSVNIWSYPGKKIIANLNKGTKLTVLDSSKKWYIKVLLPDGQIGWISSFFIE